MIPFRILVPALAALILLAGCNTYQLAAAGKPVTVANTFTLTPSRDWNKLDTGKIDTWTVDGPLLERVMVFKGIEETDPLFESQSADQDKDLPVFRASMTPFELRDLYVETMSRQLGVTLDTEGLRPARLGAYDGFRFDYSLTDENGARKRGFVVAAIEESRLFLLDYSAIALHYYEKRLPDVEALLGSAQPV